ncbi:hypothetical protein LX36DRAFT_464661 [Colletotrichum falcatum]|nr:hypothetical protein LX36DRAFT_464661 [Colletotrichum falcatum]
MQYLPEMVGSSEIPCVHQNHASILFTQVQCRDARRHAQLGEARQGHFPSPLSFGIFHHNLSRSLDFSGDLGLTGWMIRSSWPDGRLKLPFQAPLDCQTKQLCTLKAACTCIFHHLHSRRVDMVFGKQRQHPRKETTYRATNNGWRDAALQKAMPRCDWAPTNPQRTKYQQGCLPDQSHTLAIRIYHLLLRHLVLGAIYGLANRFWRFCYARGSGTCRLLPACSTAEAI